MQGDIILKDVYGTVIGRADSRLFPISIECQSYSGQSEFVMKYSFCDDKVKKGWKNKNQIKGIVVMRK